MKGIKICLLQKELNIKEGINKTNEAQKKPKRKRNNKKKRNNKLIVKQYYLMNNFFKCKLIKLFPVKCKCINSPIKPVDWQNGLNFRSGPTICYL